MIGRSMGRTPENELIMKEQRLAQTPDHMILAESAKAKPRIASGIQAAAGSAD